MHRWKVPLIGDFYNHWRRILLSSSLVACELHIVETWTGTTRRLQIDARSNQCYPKLFRDSLKKTPNISFVTNSLNIFPEALAIHLHMLLLDLCGKLYKHCYNCFLFGPVSPRFSQHLKLRSSNFKIQFFVHNNKNKKYENPLVPTDFVTKEMVWFWLDNLDSETFHSWVDFA